MQDGKNHLAVLKKELFLRTTHSPPTFHPTIQTIKNKIGCKMVKIRFHFLEEAEILIEYFSKNTKTRDFYSYKTNQKKILNLENKVISIITDIRDHEIHPLNYSIRNLFSFLKEKNILNQVSRLAIVTATPLQVVNATLFMDALKNEDNKIRIFCTPEAALHWIKPSLSLSQKQLVLNELESLKKKENIVNGM